MSISLFSKMTARLFISLILSAVLSTTAIAQNSSKYSRPGEVYLLRGLGNIFSLGLDEMGKQFTEYGFENYVHNHRHWQSLADDIIERSYENEISLPIIIIGHSLGAGAAPQMATMIGQREIPVDYVVMFDPVEPTQVGRNVSEIINYYLPKDHGTNIVTPMQEFEGIFSNINVKPLGGFTHLNIDYHEELRTIIYQRALELSDAMIEDNKQQ